MGNVDPSKDLSDVREQVERVYYTLCAFYVQQMGHKLAVKSEGTASTDSRIWLLEA